MSSLGDEGAIDHEGGKLIGIHSGAGREGEGSAGGHASYSGEDDRRSMARGVTVKYRGEVGYKQALRKHFRFSLLQPEKGRGGQ